MPLLAAMFALLGVTLGSPAVDLRAKLGDPLLVERLSDLSRTADYLRADDPSAVLKVTERNGVVFAVEVERERPEPLLGVGDHYGVRLGMSRATVKAKRGKGEIETVNTLLYPEDFSEDATFIYRFDVASADVLEAIKLVASGTTAPGDPALPQLAEAPGTNYASAILDVSPNVLESDHFRDRYLTLHGCVDSGRASIIDRRETQTFAVATATCAGKKRSFYFDITRARPAHS
jgi:hypothetical protein